MSDVSSMYVLYVLELYKWGGDTAMLKELWPTAKKAAQWHIDSSVDDGLPNYLCNTVSAAAPFASSPPQTSRCTVRRSWPDTLQTGVLQQRFPSGRDAGRVAACGSSR